MSFPDEHGAARLRTLLVTVGVLALLLVVADRAGVVIAERVAGSTIEKSQHLTSRPDVTIAGVPFLTQLARGDFQQITLTARDVPVDRTRDVLDLTQVRVVLDTVTVARDLSSVSAGKAVATALVDYAQLGKRLGVDVRFAGGGRIAASKRLTVLGRTLVPTISARPQLVNGAIAFDRVQVTGLGGVADELVPSLTKIFDLRLPLQGIPFELQVRSLVVGAVGLTVTLTGSDLTYRAG